MSSSIDPTILEDLTRVPMPKYMPRRSPDGMIAVGGCTLPFYRSAALIVGSGAAGLRAAVELRRRGVDVIVATHAMYAGTSACSGSDKQTLHTASTSFHGDNFVNLARAIGAGGAMDGDTAYVEAVGSIEAFVGLKTFGLPLPEDRYGAVLRYQTDHDEAGRATSCGPRTSRLMVKVLAEEASRLGVPFVNHATVIRLLTAGAGAKRRAIGVIAVSSAARGEANPYGLCAMLSPAVVLAAGGPGELFRDSVYPPRCFGSLGLALEAGIETVNLTEHQFGIGTPRTAFPWNLSGTYVQAMPYIHSVDASGEEHNFLADYYRTTRELASNIFRKGYQWPIHASRMLNYGSSLVDLAIFIETRKGRKVLMDFLRSPLAVPGGKPFALDDLDEDVHIYLRNNQALLPLPIDRLRRMNPLAFELYRQQGYDIAAEPLPFNVNHQHMNGGVAVDIWGQSSLPGCYAIGEAAGTHGVTRPGGAALNAGQVFGVRAAKHIAAAGRAADQDDTPVRAALAGCLALLDADAQRKDAPKLAEIRAEIQDRMSDRAGFICHAADVSRALEEARALNRRLAGGIALEHPSKAAQVFQWRQMALASEAILAALDAYIRDGGGSRGARALCAPDGEEVPQTKNGPLPAYRFCAEKPEHRNEQIVVRYTDGIFTVESRPLRPFPDLSGIFFEKNWPDFLTGEIFRQE